jgi:hypothetical protein
MATKSKSLKIKIKGIEWQIFAQTPAAYKRKHGSDSHAITYTKDREIYFNKETLAPDYVRHELLHAYVASSSTNSSSLTTDQMEELCAEMVGEHGIEMMLFADQILNFYLR